MKLYHLHNYQDYKEFVNDILEMEQPLYLYPDEDNESVILVSPEPMDDDLKTEIIYRFKDDDREDDIYDDAIWDDDLEDLPSWFLWM